MYPPALKKLPQALKNQGLWEFWYLLKLGVFFVVINCICLIFTQILALFYFNYIIYYGLLIFCCQNVAIILKISNLKFIR
jgi:uncharacterized membrane protein YvlD (DUF360 family)